MEALIDVKGLSPLPHLVPPRLSRFNQAESRSPVNRAVKSNPFRGKGFRSVITDGFTAILQAVERRVYSSSDQKKDKKCPHFRFYT